MVHSGLSQEELLRQQQALFIQARLKYQQQLTTDVPPEVTKDT
jgi:hypothetical protein